MESCEFCMFFHDNDDDCDYLTKLMEDILGESLLTTTTTTIVGKKSDITGTNMIVGRPKRDRNSVDKTKYISTDPPTDITLESNNSVKSVFKKPSSFTCTTGLITTRPADEKNESLDGKLLKSVPVQKQRRYGQPSILYGIPVIRPQNYYYPYMPYYNNASGTSVPYTPYTMNGNQMQRIYQYNQMQPSMPLNRPPLFQPNSNNYDGSASNGQFYRNYQQVTKTQQYTYFDGRTDHSIQVLRNEIKLLSDKVQDIMTVQMEIRRAVENVHNHILSRKK